MAIPFNLPSDEETEDTYRRIDQLLLDLYDLLRQIVLRQRTVQTERGTVDARIVPQEMASARWSHREQSTSTTPMPTPMPMPMPTSIPTVREEMRLASVLPDIVADLPLIRKAPSALLPSRRRRRRSDKPLRRYHHVPSTPYEDVRFVPQPPMPQTSSWLNVGIELRQIAEEITFISRNGASSTTKRRNEIKASSLFSLLVPAPVTGTFWTTVIILVGWRLLTKNR